MHRIHGYFLLIAMSTAAITGCGFSTTKKEISTASPAAAEAPVIVSPKPDLTPPVPADKSTTTSEKVVASETRQPDPSQATEAASSPAPTVPVDKAPAMPVVAAPTPLPVPIRKKDPNYFVITVAEKTPAHPNFGKGHHLGFLLDDVPGKSAVLKRGETYEFDVQTNPLHDVYFSTSPIGWGGGTVTEGIKGQFTYRGLIVVSPTENTPEIIYYQCRNHSSMGGKVVVVNKTASKADIDRLMVAGTPASGGQVESGGDQKNNPMNAAKQKIMLVELMLQSKSAKAVTESGGEVVRKILVSANDKLQSARQELGSGRTSQALTLADEALKLVTVATQSTSNEEAAKLQRGRYNEALEVLKNFQESHKQNFERTVKKRGAAAAVDYDHVKVDGLVSEARVLSDKGQHEKATQALTRAERLVTQAIQAMLNAQTIVYDLNFETPADEYEYERKRFVSYEELIPVAIEEKKPAEAVVKLMDTYVVKGRARKSEAEAKAKAGSYPEAISLMLVATEEIQRALRLAGVSQ